MRYADEILPPELTAHYIEKMLEKRNVFAQMTAEQPTFIERCINWLKTRVDKLRGVDTQAANEVDMLARKFVSTFNLNKGKVSQQLSNSKKYLIKKYENTEEKIKNNMRTVAYMDSIATLKGDEFVLGEYNLCNKVTEYYASIGNNAYNEELGDVELGKRGVKDSVAHGIGEKKTAAFKAVPEIISKGKVVDYRTKWKGHEHDTAVIAAPITLAGTEYYAAVVVRRTSSTQRFYLHEIDVQKRQTVQTEATATTNSSTQELGGLPINSIFQKLRNVNTFEKKFAISSKKYALSVVNSDGKALSAAQQDYFKDSKAVDGKGRLLSLYHGTNNTEFTVFDETKIVASTRNEGIFDKGFYFTNNQNYAGYYNRKNNNLAKDGSDRVLGVYLNLKNPFMWNTIKTEQDVQALAEILGLSRRYIHTP